MKSGRIIKTVSMEKKGHSGQNCQTWLILCTKGWKRYENSSMENKERKWLCRTVASELFSPLEDWSTKQLQLCDLEKTGEDWRLIFRRNYLKTSDIPQGFFGGVCFCFFFKGFLLFPGIYKSLDIQLRTYDSTVKRYVLINILLLAFLFSFIYVNALNKCLFAYERQAVTWKSVTYFFFFSQDMKDSDNSLTINGMEKKRRKARVFWDFHVISNWNSEGKR